jgi:three-Cys-motif partner protein
LPKEDRDPNKWRYKEQTRMKHAVLSNYLTRWGSILRRPWSNEPQPLYYVDSFAGRGRYEGGEAGSPIIAMEIGQGLHDHFDGEVYFVCHNVERDEENFESLKREVNACRPVYPNVYVTNYPGTFEDHVGTILRAIPGNAAALYFLDPWGYQNINMVIRLLKRRYNEVIVTFMSSFWNRFLGDETKASLHDENFGTTQWRELLDSPRRQQDLVKFYGRQIQHQAREKLGLDEAYIYPIDVDFGDRDQDIYHLIHASRSPTARLAMEDAVSGATRVLKQDALSLYDSSVQELVLEELDGGGTLEASRLAGNIWLSTWEATWPNIRQAVKELEAHGQVEVLPEPGKAHKVGNLLRWKERVTLRDNQLRLA